MRYCTLCFLIVVCFSFSFLSCQNESKQIDESKFIVYKVNPKLKRIKFYWKDTNNTILSNFKNLKSKIEDKQERLIFAVNGGMYNKKYHPQGLYIEKGEILKEIDTLKKAPGNFYLQPNGIFYLLKDGTSVICTTANFSFDSSINYATQSGPMLVINGEIHPKFNFGSKNLNIRNGVGILPNGHLLFVMTKEKINFYDFASYFKSKGCKHALYLDGFVSRTYLPSKNWVQLDGQFGVIIAETETY